MEQADKLCDLGFLTKFTKGDSVKIKNYIGTYLRTSQRIFEELKVAGREGNAGDMYTKAHTVKPQVQYMGIGKLQEVLIRIEQLSKEDPGSNELGSLVETAVSLYEKSTKELQRMKQWLAPDY